MYAISPIRYKSALCYLFLILTAISLQGCIEYSVPNVENTSKNIEIKKNMISDTLTVHDKDADIQLFTFQDNPSPQPILIQKIDNDHWVVILERPTIDKNKNAGLEQIKDNEFKISINPRTTKSKE